MASYVADMERAHGIKYSDLDMTEVIGCGGFGVVYRATWKSRKMVVAVKKILTIDSQQLGLKEVRLLSSLDHPHIVRFYGTVVDKPSLVAGETFVVTEFAANSSLDKHIAKHRGQPNLKQSLKWAEEIALGMLYLHQRDITHRDLKSSNVLLTSDFTAKICDLGSARVLDHTTRQKSIVGTNAWAAPEILSNGQVNKSCDVYSYGILLWELITHCVPYSDISSYLVPNEVLRGKRPRVPDSCEPYLAMLMSRCWREDSQARPPFDRILEVLETKVYIEWSYSREPADDESVEIEHSDLEFVERGGEDESGTTQWKGRWKSRHLVVSIYRGRKLSAKEVRTLGSLRHPNVIEFYGTARDSLQDEYSVTEYAENGSLFSYLHETKHTPLKDQRLRWIRQIAEGMQYLHDSGIVHFDLKSSRVLLAADLTAKIFNPCINNIVSSLQTTHSKIGSFGWSSPELLNGEDCSKPSDVYSYGIMVWEILTQQVPFSATSSFSVVGDIISGKRPPIPKSGDAYLFKLIQQCWKGQPEARPTFDMVLQVLNDNVNSKTTQANLIKAQRKQLEILQTLFECMVFDISSLQLEVDTKKRLLHKPYIAG